jgi:hypothetical protein
MKRILVLAAVLALLVQPGLAFTRALPAPEYAAPDGGEIVTADDPVAPGPGAAKTFAQGQPEPQARGMPGWPIPERPVPHHEPGHPSKAADYTTQVTRLNVEGVEEAVQLSGIDAMLADGRMDDPLQGNYRVVNRDKLMWASYGDWFIGKALTLQTFELVTPTLRYIPGSLALKSLYRFYDIAAGDLNGDLQDEQITAWIGGGNQIYLSLGEMPGSLGRVTSAPAAVSSNGELDLVVRGYDDALWYHDGASWQNAGGRLLSGPAVASRAADQFDVFAAGLDDSVEPNYLVVWHNQWDGANWAGWEALDDPDEGSPPSVWPTVGRNVPTPEFSAPAVVTNGSNQLDLFWLWPDNTLRWRHFDGTVWGPWVNLGGMLASGPGAVAHDGQIDVFARGVDEALWTLTYRNDNWERRPDGSYNWQRVELQGMPEGVTIASAPAAVSPAAGQVLVIVRGSDDRLWQLAYDGSSWGDWYPAGADKSTTPGRIGGALALDGVDDYVDLPDNFPNVPEFTFAAWVYWNGGDPWQRIFDFGQDTNSNMFLTPSDGTNMRFAITTGGAGSELRLNAPSPLSQSEWVHVAVTLNGSQGVLYINGSAVDTQSITLTPQDVVGENTWLGRSQYVADPTFNGSIDEVVVFDQALSASEISGIYNTGWGSLSDKVLALHLDENPATHGTTLIDASSFGNDGTLYTFGSSKLAAAPAVVAHGGQIDLFARTRDGHLGHALYDGSTWTDWSNFEGLAVEAVYPTGATTVAPPANDALENLLLDVETGYFTGDGREQIALAYQSAAGEIQIELYDIHDGFIPTQTARLAAPIAGTVPRIAAADVDGDGTDEVGIAHLVDDIYHYKVEVYDVEEVAGSWTGNLVKLPNESPRFYSCSGGCDDWDDDAHWFAGTLRITSGDFVADPDPKNPNEEIAVLSDWGDTRDSSYPLPAYDLWVQLYILDNDYDAAISDCRPETDPSCPMADMWRLDSYDENFWDNGYATGVALGAGDVDGNGYDEIVLSWPYWFDGHDWPDLVRTLRALDARNVNPTSTTPSDRKPTIMAEHFWIPIPGTPTYQRDSYLDTLAVGDLDRDLQDEIVFYQLDELQFYEYNTQSEALELISTIYLASGDHPKVSLVMGDFTGESVRVGPPNYRRQYGVGRVTAIINAPPKHVDVLNGVTYNINADDPDTKAQLTLDQGTMSHVSLTTKRDWGLSATFATTIGDPEATHTTNSLTNSYGENFSDQIGYETTFDIEQTRVASADDALFYIRTDYDVWEYPVLIDSTGTAASYMSVIFPASAPWLRVDRGNTCDSWYQSRHQLSNVWSYPSSAEQLVDRDEGGGGDLVTSSDYLVSDDPSSFTVNFISVDDLKQTSGFDLGFSHEFEWQIGGEEIGFEIFGFDLKTKLPSFKFSSKTDYNYSQLAEWEVTTTDSTEVYGYLNGVPGGATEGYDYAVWPYLYWAEDGYLMLDYTTSTEGMFWTKYDKPDPAFILPWTDGQCNTAEDPQTEAFTRDILIDPPMVSSGDPVTLTATVRNFSLQSNTKAFNVTFYLGDPDAGGTQIGAPQVIGAYELGPRDVETVTVHWTATGVGDQRIYAVIDAANQLAEVHDETDPYINNNKGYGLLRLGALDFVDMGEAAEQIYYQITYGLNPTMQVSLFVPVGNLAENTRFDFQDADLAVAGIAGKAFELLVYRGEQPDPDTPEEDYSFQPDGDHPPAVMTLSYADGDIAGMDEGNLTLYRLEYGRWKPATCPGYEVQRFPEDNLLAVPLCRASTFALREKLGSSIYLPVVLKNTP